jgi:uncharacterized membrane protein
MELESIATNTQSQSSVVAPATGSAKINVGSSERIGSVLLGAASAVYGLRNLNSLNGIALSITGGMLLYRGLTGYCAVNNAIGRNSVSKKTSAMETDQSFLINKPKEEVYAFWRKLENLPMFMKHLEDVTVEDNVRSTWRAKVPGALATVVWQSEITEDIPNELISWASLPGSTIDNAGEVRFRDAISGRSTEIEVKMTYRLPGGDIGSLAGKLFNPVVEKMIHDDIKNLKGILETGESQLLTEETETFVDTTTATSFVKTKKPRQTRKKPDASLGNRSDTRDRDVNQSELLERNDLDY